MSVLPTSVMPSGLVVLSTWPLQPPKLPCRASFAAVILLDFCTVGSGYTGEPRELGGVMFNA